MSGADPLGVFDDHSYSTLAMASSESYRTAEPFPHGVYDDFLPHDLAISLAASFPTFDSIEWVVRDNEQNRRVLPARRDQAAASAQADAPRAQ